MNASRLVMRLLYPLSSPILTGTTRVPQLGAGAGRTTSTLGLKNTEIYEEFAGFVIRSF